MQLPDEVGDLHVEREEDNVVIRFEYKDDRDDDLVYLPPLEAFGVAQYLQQAATDAQRFHKKDN